MFVNVIDTIVPIEIQEELLAVHTDNYFPWYFQNKTSYHDYKDDGNTVDCFQLSHGSCYDNKKLSNVFDYTKKIVDCTMYRDLPISRIKSNLTTNLSNYNENLHQPIHVDSDNRNFVSMLYYVNDSDGGTMFFDENDKIVEKIEAKKGRLVIFPSTIKHAGCNPINTQYKIIVNYILDNSH